MTILSRLVHWEKAALPIFVTVSGIVMFVRSEHLANAAFPIDRMPIVWYTVYRIKKERATKMMMVFKILVMLH